LYLFHWPELQFCHYWISSSADGDLAFFEEELCLAHGSRPNAWLKLVETRFNRPSLTKRDAAQMDMTEFFDFQNPPWLTPPSNIPKQAVTGPCYTDHLP